MNMFYQNIQAGILSSTTGTFTTDHLWQVEQILYDNNAQEHVVIFVIENLTNA
jgi:hypothetical protein